MDHVQRHPSPDHGLDRPRPSTTITSKPPTQAEMSKSLEIVPLVEKAIDDDGGNRSKALSELRRLLKTRPPIGCLPTDTCSKLAKSLMRFPATARIASQCLLQLVSNSSPAMLRREASPVFNSVLTTLSAAVHQPKNDQLVMVVYLLRILSNMTTKVGLSLLSNLSEHVDCIRILYQLSVPSHPYRPRERIVLNFQPSIEPIPSASYSPSQCRYSESEASSDSDVVGFSCTNERATQCRLDALTYLGTIAELDAKALYPYWSQLLPTYKYQTYQAYTLLTVLERDPQILVRLRACGTLKKLLEGSESYMAIAEEKNSRMSYISLSAQIAAITVELHLRLARILRGPVISSDLTQAMLDFCEVVVKISAYNRISTQILSLLLDSIFALCKSNVAPVQQRAQAALTLSLQHLGEIKLTSQLITPLLNDIVSFACAQIQFPDSPITISAMCQLLHGTLGLVEWNQNLLEKVQVLCCCFDVIPTSQDEASAKFALLGTLAVFFPEPDFDKHYVTWAKARLQQDGIDSLSLIMSSKCERCKTYVSHALRWDLLEMKEDVRALRLIGIIISKKYVKDSHWVAKVALRFVSRSENIKLPDSEEQVLSTILWVLANCLQVTKDLASVQALDRSFDRDFLLRAIRLGLHMLSHAHPNDAVKTNSVRCCGLGVCLFLSNTRDFGDDDLVEAVVLKICGSLAEVLPKVQWNAATILRQILVVMKQDSFKISSRLVNLKETIFNQLYQILQISPSFKVRIQTCRALQVISEQLAPQAFAHVEKIYGELGNSIKAKHIPSKEIEHARLLHLEIGRLLHADSSPDCEC
ncbi:hypothetical protein O181_002976 [Austropuccinia psidii MF-1]|uniref:DUF4042 domain-containing protein n=1 Tax=Austropuccinia psidii MF-1 TaxID=1389203 RepID=A0A9Q3BCX9_9BASI|nr:hypothetical protein [Austropuccinia psidii MF-1]